MLQRGMDVFSMLDGLKSAGFRGGIDIGCTHDDLVNRSELLKDHPEILLAGAMGPWEAGASETKTIEVEKEFSQIKGMEQIDRELGILKTNLGKYKVRFIGEIGLDYYWEYGTHEKQRHIFQTQMQWANEMGLCVLIHDREADADVADAIRRIGPGKGGVIHCFDGSEIVLEAALERNYYISFAGNLTYKANQNLRDMLKRVPSDRLLMETDSPYLSPVPLRGKPNCPANVIYTYQCAAEVLGISLQELSERVLENFTELCER